MMEKTISNTVTYKESHKHNADTSKKRLTRFNFYLRQIGSALKMDTLSLYK